MDPMFRVPAGPPPVVPELTLPPEHWISHAMLPDGGMLLSAPDIFDVEVSDDMVHWTRAARGVLDLGSTVDLKDQVGGRLGQFYRLVPAAP